jgi:fused signal recognition particle receptor
MTEKKAGFFARLKSGLSRTSGNLTSGIGDLFTKRKLDQTALDDLEDLLIGADLGPNVAAKVTGRLAENRFDKEVSDDEVREALGQVVEEILAPVAAPLAIDPENRPHVILVVGVNGTGKTTTIGKIANSLKAADKKVVLAAADTFRAAAIDQLKIWGERTNCEVITREVGADPAAVAYEAMAAAKDAGADVLLIDTAGRLHNKSDLMAELEKIVRVIGKQDQTAPHSVLLVLDATTGQNALRQVEVFTEVANVTGLAMTKLDGTARGGVMVAVADRFAIPIHLIGIGEAIDDLQPFDATEFAQAIAGGD